VLAEHVFAGGRSKRFAELTADEVKARAAELKAATGWGPTAKVATVAMAWGELSRLMKQSNARPSGAGPRRGGATRREALGRPRRAAASCNTRIDLFTILGV
jgi:hypothetical protein